MAHKVQLKFYATPSSTLPLDAFVPIFHKVIRDKRLRDEVVIDVADYAHVQDGPGIVLIGHDADYYMDEGEGRLGLLYSRKRRGADDLAAAIEDAFRRALFAAQVLEAESKDIHFGVDEVLLRINDRLHAKNDKKTFDELSGSIRTALERVYGTRFEVMQEGTERELFTVRVKAQSGGTPNALLAHLGS